MNNIKLRKFILIFFILLLLGLFVYAYKERYINCILIEPVTCLKSSKFISTTRQFTFRYPQDYPLTFKTSKELREIYGFNDYDEWVNFSSEFYPNAGGDRLGVITVQKTNFKNIGDYANKIRTDFDKLPTKYKGVSPKIDYLKISGKDVVHIFTAHKPASFNPASDDYYVIKDEKLYTIGFDYNEYYHKLPLKYYKNSKMIILLTFTFI